MKKLILFLLCSLPVVALYAGGFSRLPISARAVTMGGSLVALGDDPNVLFSNPGAIASLSSLSLSTSYTQLLTGITDDQLNYFSGSAVANLGILGNFGVGVKVFTSQLWKENEFIGAYGRSLLFDWIRVGGSVKLLHWSVPAPSGRLAVPEPALSKVTLSFDVGGQLILEDIIPENEIRIGASVGDLTRPSIAADGSKEGRLERKYVAGVSYASKVHQYVITAHYTVQGRIKRFGAGMEFVALRTSVLGQSVEFTVRVGGGAEPRPSRQGDVDGGFGLQVAGLKLDYAYTHQTELQFVGGTHHLSLRYEL